MIFGWFLSLFCWTLEIIISYILFIARALFARTSKDLNADIPKKAMFLVFGPLPHYYHDATFRKVVSFICLGIANQGANKMLFPSSFTAFADFYFKPLFVPSTLLYFGNKRRAFPAWLRSTKTMPMPGSWPKSCVSNGLQATMSA